MIRWYKLKQALAYWLECKARSLQNSVPCPYNEDCTAPCEYCGECMQHGESCIEGWEGNKPIFKKGIIDGNN